MNLQQQSIFQPIYPYVLTTRQADELFVHIDNLLTHLYSAQNQSFEKIAYAVLDPQIAQSIQQIFNQRNLQWTNVEDVKSFLLDLKNNIRSFEVLTLTLPFNPSDQTLIGFANWSRTNLAPRILLEINIDKTLIAGTVAVFRGHYFDMSLKKRIDEIFAKQKNTILNQVRRQTPASLGNTVNQKISEPVHQPTAI